MTRWPDHPISRLPNGSGCQRDRLGRKAEERALRVLASTKAKARPEFAEEMALPYPPA